MRADWSYPIPISLGPGRIADLPALCRRAGVAHPLIVALAGDPALDAARLIFAEDETPTGVFDRFGPAPDERDLGAAIASFVVGRHDGVVALGGDEAVSLARLIGVMDGRSEPLGDVFAAPVEARAPPVLAVVGLCTIASAPVARLRDLGGRPLHVADAAIGLSGLIIDPDLAAPLSPAAIAADGVRALAAALGGYADPAFHPFSDGVALEAVGHLSANLAPAFWRPANRDAVAGLAVGAALAGVAGIKARGPVEPLIDAIGEDGQPPGIALIAGWLRAFRPVLENRVGRLAPRLGLAGGIDGLQNLLTDLACDIGAPPRLSAMGVAERDLASLAARAARCRPDVSEADYMKILQSSF